VNNDDDGYVNLPENTTTGTQQSNGDRGAVYCGFRSNLLNIQ